MLSFGTENLITKLLLNIADGEKAVENIRQVLADQVGFEAYNTFCFLDRESKNYVDEFNIQDFLKKHSIFSTLSDVRQIIAHYDTNLDGRLNLDEYLNLVVSDLHPSIRRLANERSIYGPRRADYPHYDIEYSLAKLFERELDLVRAIQIVVSDLSFRYDYTVNNLFNDLDNYNFGYLTGDNFRKFLIRNNINATNGDIDAIIRRLDINRDRRITVREVRTVCNSSSLSSSTTSSNFYSRAMSDPRTRKVENTTTSSSLYRPTYSPSKKVPDTKYSYPTSNIYHSPKKERDVATAHLSPSRYTKPSIEQLERRRSPYKTSSETIQENYEEHNFQAFLKDIIMWENEIERLKSDLALRSDFNLPDAFRVFEVDKRGYFNDLDFKYGANFLDVFPTSEEITLTFKRFTNGGEVLFTYADFCEMMCPVDKEYYLMMKNRVPLEYRYDRYDFFHQETRVKFGTLVKLIVECEYKVEGWRRKLKSLDRFCSRFCFDKLDSLRRGYLTKEDFADYFLRNGITYLNRDLDLLFYRFDLDGDGRVLYSELSEEMNPKVR